jgi:hypothetical protein
MVSVDEPVGDLCKVGAILCARQEKLGISSAGSTCNDDATCVNAFQTPVHKGKAKVVHMTRRNGPQIGRTFIISLSSCDLGSQP